MNIVNKLGNLVDKISRNPICWSCGLNHAGKKLICDECISHIIKVNNPCVQCGLTHELDSKICVHCLSKPRIWQHMVAPLSYQTPVSQLIHQLKYNQNLGVLKALIELVENEFHLKDVGADLLIPVPLHTNRYIERGFNQSLEIAKRLSRISDIAVNDDMIERIVDTTRQSELKLKQREKNIKNAFLVDDKIVNYQHVIIVDDVVTSGSTVYEIAKECLRKGVKRVDIWALARAELQT